MTTITVGEKVTYWRDKRPLLPNDGHAAEVVAVTDATHARLLVANARTGRTFYADAELSEGMFPGKFTRAKEATQPEAKAAEPMSGGATVETKAQAPAARKREPGGE